MALPVTAKGLIITKGLCGPACCALLTAPFGLACGCFFTITVEGNQGGGWYPHPVTNIPGIPPNSPYYTPAPRRFGKSQRMVVITAGIGTRTWKRTYLVDEETATIIVRITGLFNIAKNAIRVAVSELHHIMKKVIAVFKQDDK